MQRALRIGDVHFVKNQLEQGYQFTSFDFDSLNVLFNTRPFIFRLSGEIIWQLMIDYTQVPTKPELLEHYNHLLLLREDYSKSSLGQRYPYDPPKIVTPLVQTQV